MEGDFFSLATRLEAGWSGKAQHDARAGNRLNGFTHNLESWSPG
jgi:hypothetical protein